MEIVTFKIQPQFNAIRFDGSNLAEIKNQFNADIRESHMGTPGLFIDGTPACEIRVGDIVTQEIGSEANIAIYDPKLFSEIFKKI